MPTLAGVIGGWRKLRKAARFPPEHERNRVERNFDIALLRRDVGVESEEGRAEICQVLDDVLIVVRDAEAQPLRVQRAVTHEIADELCQFGRHGLWHTRP